MADSLRGILRHALVYGAGNVLSRAVGFLLIPIYTRFLTPADYGALMILDLIVMVVSMLVGAGLAGSVARYYYAYRDERDRAEVLSTAAIACLVATSLAALLAAQLARPLAAALLEGEDHAGWVRLALVSYVLNLNVELGFSFVRTQQRSGRFVALSLARLALQISFNAYLIAFARLGVAGYLWSAVISGAAMLAYLLASTLRCTGVRVSRAKLGELLRYTAPLVPATAGTLVVNFADRVFLRAFTDLATVGLYSLGHRFGLLVSEFVIQPFLRIWGVSRYEAYESGGAGASARESGRAFTYYVLALATFWLCMSAAIEDVIRVIAAPGFRGAARFVPIVALGQVFRGVAYFYETGAHLVKRPGIVAWSNVLAAAVSVAMNAALVPALGAMGAALAAALTFAAQAGYIRRRAGRLFPFEHERARLAKIAAAAVGCYALSEVAPFERLGLAIAWSAGAAALFPVVLAGLGFFRADEVDALRSKLGRRRARAVPAEAAPAPASEGRAGAAS